MDPTDWLLDETGANFILILFLCFLVRCIGNLVGCASYRTPLCSSPPHHLSVDTHIRWVRGLKRGLSLGFVGSTHSLVSQASWLHGESVV